MTTKTSAEEFPYKTYLNILHGPLEVVDVQKLADACTDKWYNQTLCQVNDAVVRLGVLEGEYHWHEHNDIDEFFFVLDGKFLINIDHHAGKVLAYVFGRRKDEVFLKLKALLDPFGLTRYYTDHWGAYTRHLDPDVHSPGKRNTKKIERKHLTLRARIKRLVRKTICFSKSIQMHDIVIGLFAYVST